MRRYLLYFTVAFIAFGIGISTAFKFFWQTEEKCVLVQKGEEITTEKVFVQKQEESPQKIDYSQLQPFTIKKNKFTCNDKVLSVIWKKLQDEPYFVEVSEEVIRKEISNCKEIFTTKLIDLNKDNIQEITVRGNGGMPFCGATGNCSMWILRKRNNNYEIILDAGSIEEINFENKLSEKFSDVQTRYHFGGSEHFLAAYRFDGKKYRIKECLEETISTNGEKHLATKKLRDCQ